MSDVLLFKAKRLAERPYQIEIECEPGELSSDIPRFTACIKEMPYCVAQGFTEAEARQEIRSVLVDYILSLLARNMHIPEPEIKYSGYESGYTIRWLWEGWFVHANESVLEHLTSKNKPLQTFMYTHSK